MCEFWDFFENLDELVYVSRVDTYEMVYMNRYLRQLLGYHLEEDYRGKPCYQVLQNREDPCPFCSNGKLRQGEFVSWVSNNPILKRRLLVKDTLIRQDGKDYHLEIAINGDPDTGKLPQYFFARNETILTECLQRSIAQEDPEEGIQNMLDYLGNTFGCSRVCVFELTSGQVAANTYEWCRQPTLAQKELLQQFPLSAIDWWMDAFSRQEAVAVENLEDIRETHPETYALLKAQGPSSVVAGPIEVQGKLAGFLGMDNPNSHLVPMLTMLLKNLGYFFSTLFRRREMLTRLHDLSYHDQLTGALNRHALSETFQKRALDSVGVVYCDIIGLKHLNDTQGHEAGDQMICGCYELICGVMDSGQVYRLGGDEFVVLCPNCAQEEFADSVGNLQGVIRQDGYRMSVGAVWSDQKPLNLEKLILQADRRMYQDKRDYYLENEEEETWEDPRLQEEVSQPAPGEGTPLEKFLESSCYDIDTLYQAVTQDNHSGYFYMGNLEEDLFYLSDNMRDDFGFAHNQIHGLFKQWIHRIPSPEFQNLYWQELTNMITEKRTFLDLRYWVKDIHGASHWVRDYGILRWNQDRTRPVFFAARITHQDNNFVVDPVSNFLREHAALHQLGELRKQGEKTLVIGFRLNGVTEVNVTKGRGFGDRLLQKCGEALQENLSWKMSFYRMEGMRCMAIVNPVFRTEGAQVLIGQIRAVVKDCYQAMGIPLDKVCAFALMEYPWEDFTPQDLVENLVSLIRVAKQDHCKEYVDYTTDSIRQIRQMSNLVLALTQDVNNHMEHFRVVIQPVVSAGDGRPIGGEVLLRWRFQGKDVSPGLFIPILERSNLIQTVGRWVFEQTVSACVRIHIYDPTFFLTFNVSLYQLSDTKLPDYMRETLEKYRLPGRSLVAELTESSLDEQPELLNAFLDRCQEMGMYVALDDFGSGYSSLRMLLQYPCSIIKLDRSLMLEVTESQEKMNFVRSIVYACHQFGKTVCIEGVEREDQNQIILHTGCDLIQGFYYYHPMELGEIYQMLSQR